MDNTYSGGDRIPRELMHTQGQDERLTNKHIQTLSFLKEMAEENKMLKQRVSELEVIEFHEFKLWKVGPSEKRGENLRKKRNIRHSLLG